MNKEEKIKEYLSWSHKKFKSEQNRYIENHTFKNYYIQYFEDVAELLLQIFKGVIALLVFILSLVLFPLGCIYEFINWNIYKGSKLNYYYFRKELLKRQEDKEE